MNRDLEISTVVLKGVVLNVKSTICVTKIGLVMLADVSKLSTEIPTRPAMNHPKSTLTLAKVCLSYHRDGELSGFRISGRLYDNTFPRKSSCYHPSAVTYIDTPRSHTGTEASNRTRAQLVRNGLCP